MNVGRRQRAWGAKACPARWSLSSSLQRIVIYRYLAGRTKSSGEGRCGKRVCRNVDPRDHAAVAGRESTLVDNNILIDIVGGDPDALEPTLKRCEIAWAIFAPSQRAVAPMDREPGRRRLCADGFAVATVRDQAGAPAPEDGRARTERRPHQAAPPSNLLLSKRAFPVAHFLDPVFSVCSNIKLALFPKARSTHLGAFASMRLFRLSDGGVQCGENGFFVGSTPMLVGSPRPGGGHFWAVRPSDELDCDLGAVYGLPIDVASKRDGLAGVARALERGEMALAKIAAVLLGFPDPPVLAKDAPAPGSLELAAQLFWSGLLKGDWDPAKHPRTGEPPNPGRFAPTRGEPEAGPLAPGWPSPSVRQAARALIRQAAKAVVKVWSIAAWSNPILKAIEVTLAVMEPSETNRGEQQLIDQLRASLDPPKTLDELQTPPTQNVLGYEVHHIVEQNKDNIAKSPCKVDFEKFGRAVIDDPSNLVWVPRLKHELITAYYNSTDADDPQGRLRRQVVNAMDFASQYQAGLAAMQEFGVLQ
jgi:hypothetical protein